MSDLREITAGTGFQAGSPSVTLDRWTYRSITAVQPGALTASDQNLTTIRNRATERGAMWMRMDYTGGDTAAAESAIVRMMNGNMFATEIEDFYLTFRNTAGNVIETTNFSFSNDLITGAIGFDFGNFSENRHPSFRVAPWSRAGATGMWMVVNNIGVATTGFGGNIQVYSRFTQYGQGLGNAGLDLQAGVIDDPTDGYTNFIFTLPTNIRDRLAVDGEEPIENSDRVGNVASGAVYKSGLYLERFVTQTAEDNTRTDDRVLAVNANGEVVLAPESAQTDDSIDIRGAIQQSDGSFLRDQLLEGATNLLFDNDDFSITDNRTGAVSGQVEIKARPSLQVQQEGETAISNIDLITFDNRHFSIIDRSNGDVEVVLTASAAGGGAQVRGFDTGDNAVTAADPAIISFGTNFVTTVTNAGTATETATVELDIATAAIPFYQHTRFSGTFNVTTNPTGFQEVTEDGVTFWRVSISRSAPVGRTSQSWSANPPVVQVYEELPTTLPGTPPRGMVIPMAITIPNASTIRLDFTDNTFTGHAVITGL